MVDCGAARQYTCALDVAHLLRDLSPVREPDIVAA